MKVVYLVLIVLVSSFTISVKGAAKDSFTKLLDLFPQPQIVGNCRVWFSGDGNGTGTFYFQKPYRNGQPPTGALDVADPKNTNYRTRVVENGNLLRYMQGDTVGWTVMDVQVGQRSNPIFVEVFKVNALGVKYKTDVSCGKRLN